MQKSTLEQNILRKAKQRFIVQNLPEVVVLQRGSLDVGVGAIELPDGTKVSGGRVEPGEFTVTLQFADDLARGAYIGWFKQAVDVNGQQGVNPNYKRNGSIRFLRAIGPNQQVNVSPAYGKMNAPEVTVMVYGLWCMKYTVPEADIDATDGDGDTTIECTLSYDSAEVIIDGN